MKLLGSPWTIRTRLTLLYAGAFFVAGVVLIVVIYLYLGLVLDRQFVVRLEPGPPAPGNLPPLVGEDAGPVQTLIRQARLNTLDTMLIASLVLVGVFSVIAGIIGWIVAGHALRPLRDITATARRVADRSLHERIALTGPDDEIKDLADTLDAMLERLDRSFDSQHRFVANASHELRTPLTITRTLIEVALLEAGADDKVRQLGTTLLAVNQRHEKLIDGLLTLASSEQSPADAYPVDLGEVASHVVSELRPIAEGAGVALETDLCAGAVLGDPVLIERLIQNLVENAIQYNLSRDGWVRVRTDTGGGRVELVVENTGPRVPAHEVPSLSSRSAAWPRPSGLRVLPGCRASAARGLGCRSCAPSSIRSAGRCRPRRAKMEASSSVYEFRPRRTMRSA